MEFRHRDRPIRVFTISPRTTDAARYWPNIVQAAALSERHGATGVLLFTGNDVYIDPWVAAQSLLAAFPRIVPLVAVNPIYMHPFTAAKIVMSLSTLYGRKLYLNLVTGTALSYLTNLGDRLEHDDRYDRLLEYATLIRRWLSTRATVTQAGRFYQVADTQMLPGLPPALAPEFLLAGGSPKSLDVGRRLEAVGMRMLPPTLADGLADTPAVRGLHFGIVARPTDAAARQAAEQLFPWTSEGEDLLALSMRNTDAAWKRQLHRTAAADVPPGSPYWLEPFRRFQADCPYLVGSHERLAAHIAALVQRGVDTFILDIPAAEEEFAHTQAVFARAARLVSGVPAGA